MQRRADRRDSLGFFSENRRKAAALGCLLCLLAAGAVVEARFSSVNTRGEDIFYSFKEGSRILAGENPYARIHDGDMRTNQKYATYFPVFYELSALSQWLGLRDYAEWISFWRVIFIGFNLAITALLFLLVYPCGGLPAALLAAGFWQFGRWTLYVVKVAHLDFMTLFFLILSLALLPTRRRIACLLLGVSFGLKQIGLFIAPLYLIWAWQAAEEGRRLRETALAALAIAAVPVLASIPFLAVDAPGYIKSVLFSATRDPSGDLRVTSLGEFLGWQGLSGRLPMIALTFLVYLVAWRRFAGRYTAVMLVMAIFIDFNPVLFGQYFVWLVPFVPLVLCDLQAQRGVTARP